MRTRLLSLLLAAGFGLAAAEPALAGLKVVRAEGRAAISGNDVARARRAALAEALYDAAGQVGTKVRGAGHLSTQGVMTEETSMLVQGTLRDHRVVNEYKEHGRYVVVIEALAESDGSSCGTKRIDLDVRPIRVQIAPGLSGAVVKAAHAAVDRGIEGLAGATSFRAIDNRDLPFPGGTEGAARTDYASLLYGTAPNPSGYSISGVLTVEKRRNDNIIAENTAIVGTLTLKLRDSSNGGTVETIVNTHALADRNRIWGTDVDFNMAGGSIDFSPLWQKALDDLESRLGCRPLRAKVLDVAQGMVTLSVGSENGINEGDYFLLDLPGRKTGNWQVIRIERTGLTTAQGRMLKGTPTVPAGVMATLLQ